MIGNLLIPFILILFCIVCAKGDLYEQDENIVQLNQESFYKTLLEDKKNVWMVQIYKDGDCL